MVGWKSTAKREESGRGQENYYQGGWEFAKSYKGKHLNTCIVVLTTLYISFAFNLYVELSYFWLQKSTCYWTLKINAEK